MEFKMVLPLKHIRVNQPFGTNYLDFYKDLGYLGHNGIDFKAFNGCPVMSAHAGFVWDCYKDSTGGIGVEIVTDKKGKGFKTTYYHLKDYLVAKGQQVTSKQIIGLADNTGKYTTGDHLHFTLKECIDGNTINYSNGYKGAIDPAPYFPKDFDKSPAYHRYYLDIPRNLKAEIDLAWKNTWVHRQLLKRGKSIPLSPEQINALIYGYWSFEDVMNIAMYDLWSQMTKPAFLAGEKPFNA